VKDQVNYPSDIVWEEIVEWDMIRLNNYKHFPYERYGTYEVVLGSQYESKDLKIACLADNRQWKFDNDKFISYINRENPAYVFDIDISSILKDFTLNQKDHGAIPDMKRWLSSYFSGFANMISEKVNESNSDLNTEKISTLGDTSDLTTKESVSDIIIEIWDGESIVGNNGEKGNWRPFMSVTSDIKKVPGRLMSDNVTIIDDSIDIDDNPGAYPLIPSLHRIVLGYYEYNVGDTAPNLIFPEEFIKEINGLGALADGGPVEKIDSNLVLYDETTKTSFHIAYLRETEPGDAIGASNTILAYIKHDPAITLDTTNPSDPQDPGFGTYQVREGFKTISKSYGFSTDSIRAVDGADEGYLTRFLDIRSELNSPSDFERFVEDNKISFRVRVVKGNKRYKASYIDDDSSELSYVGDNIDNLADPSKVNSNLNNPWVNPDNTPAVDKLFNWGKIRAEESVRKLGLTHFKCSSK